MFQMLPVEVLILILNFVDVPTLFTCSLILKYDTISRFVDFSQFCGGKLSFILLTRSFFRSKLEVGLRRHLVARDFFTPLEDLSFFMRTHTLPILYPESYQIGEKWSSVDMCLEPGFCYARLFHRDYDELICRILGPMVSFSKLKDTFSMFDLARTLTNDKTVHRVISDSWFSIIELPESRIHLTKYEKDLGWNTASGFFRNKRYLMSVVGAPQPVKVALSTDGVEDEILSLMGGNENEMSHSREKTRTWVHETDFEKSCELRFKCLEKSMERVIQLLERTDGESLVPNDSASRVHKESFPSRSILPVIEEVSPTEFSLTHPGWNPIQYETDLNLAMGCSGVVDGEILPAPDPGVGGLVPRVTIDQRLNFLIRLHTALFKLLSEDENYPGKDFLAKFKTLRDDNIGFDHPSLDLLEIVLEDTVDWKRHLVKRNLFKIPGFHPGCLLTERIIGNALVSLKEEYKMRWNSLVGDCVLPSMLSNSRWSDDRVKLQDHRERRHKVNEGRRLSDKRSTHRSRSGWSQLSSS